LDVRKKHHIVGCVTDLGNIATQFSYQIGVRYCILFIGELLNN
jgi:hypothetical protein